MARSFIAVGNPNHKPTFKHKRKQKSKSKKNRMAVACKCESCERPVTIARSQFAKSSPPRCNHCGGLLKWVEALYKPSRSQSSVLKARIAELENQLAERHSVAPPAPAQDNSFNRRRLMDPQGVIDDLIAQTARQAAAIHLLTQENERLRSEQTKPAVEAVSSLLAPWEE